MYRTLPAVLALSLVACSTSSTSSDGGTTGGTTTTGGNITVENFNAAFNHAVCEFELTCAGSNGVPYAPYIDSVCSSVVYFDESGLPAAVDAGRIKYDAAQATACVNALNAVQCNELNLTPCLPILAGGDGLVAPGGACYSGADCRSESCAGNNITTCTPGTCAGVVGLGGACGCTNCGSCDPDAGLTCANSVCVQLGTAGQPCNDSTHGACVFGLGCVANICTTLPIAAGGSCNARNGQCASGTYCYEASGASTGNCATSVAAGQPCGEDANHAPNAFTILDNECAGSHPVCVGAGTLVDAGIAPGICGTLSDVGGPCTPPAAAIDPGQNYNTGCYYGLNCVGGACVKPPSSGTCSDAGVACDLTTSFCASATNHCLPYVAAGGTCDPTDTDPCGFIGNCETPNDICQASTASCKPTM